MSNFILWPHRVHLRQLKTGLCILLTKTVDLFLVLLVFKCFCYIWLPNDGWGGKTVGRNIACLNHCTWSLLLYLQPINKLTSQCEIRTLWTELATNNRGLSFDMSTRCIDRSMHMKTPDVKHSGKHTIGFQGVKSSAEGEPIYSGPDPSKYWQEICTHSSFRTLNQSEMVFGLTPSAREYLGVQMDPAPLAYFSLCTAMDHTWHVHTQKIIPKIPAE